MTEPRLSNYLTDDEWDALLYLVYGPLGEEHEGNLGQTMDAGIQEMLELGYVFEHLDEAGEPDIEKGESDSINWMKVQIFTGNPHHLDPLEHAAGGRAFIKQNTPELLHDTDDEFEEGIATARDKMAELVEKQRKDIARMQKGWVQIPIPEGVVNRELVEERIYRNGQLCGVVQEVEDDMAWAIIDHQAFLEAGEGDIVFGLVQA